MLESHNDTAVAIAEYLGGSVKGFADKMNEKARELGCESTSFVTPNGLDDEKHYTTAKELCMISAYAIQNEDFLKIIQTPQYQFQDQSGKRSFTVNNHDAFLGMYDGAIGIKTGFTGNAGYCYVGALTRDDRTFIVALLACGWPSNKTYKWADTKKLMQYGITQFKKIKLDEIILDEKENAPVRVIGGQSGKIGGKISTELEIAPIEGQTELLIGNEQEVQVKYELSAKLYAPVTEGDFAGEITYLLGDEVLAKRVVTVKNTIKKIDFCWCIKKTAELFPL